MEVPLSTVDEATRIQELRRAMQQVDPGAYLAEARVLRRIIREQHSYARLSTAIPHTDSQVVAATDLKALTHPDELGLRDFNSLLPYSILIAQPEEDQLNHWPMQELLQLVWRRLYHASVDRALQDACRGPLNRAAVQQRIAAIGQVEFDEAHAVLRSELRLLDPASRVEAYCEFCAVWLELRHFSPDLLPVWFPSLKGSDDVDAIAGQSLPADDLFTRTRLYGAAPPDLTPRVSLDEARLESSRHDWSLRLGVRASDRAFVRHMRQRDRANDRGNTVAAAVCGMRATEQSASVEKRETARQKVREDLNRLVSRIRSALSFPEDDIDDWQLSLQSLLTNAAHGFWNADKRLLYDLQKVCIDHERTTYRVDLVKWIVSRGRRPLRRPLTSVREVMMARHLASAAGRLVSVRLSGGDRQRLQALLQDAAQLAETQMRQRMRPAIRQALLEVGAAPQSIPEQVAFDKLIEESLDCIADRGYLTMGYLRDAISRNDLKLDDLREPGELIRGDHLLRVDDRLDVALDGVYRRGEFYLRWLQVTSSLFFGTRTGRFATLFLAIPFGGALIIVEGVRHLWHVVSGRSHPADAASSATDGEPTAAGTQTDGESAFEPAGDDGRPPDALREDSAQQNATGRNDDAANASDAAPPAESSDSTDHVAIPRPVFRLPADTKAIAPQQHLSSSAPDGYRLRLTSLTFDEGPEDALPADGTPVELIAADPEPDPLEQVFAERVSSLTQVLIVGILLMGLIHSLRFRSLVLTGIRFVWKTVKGILLELPRRILQFPLVQIIWRSRLFVRIRRMVVTPFLAAWLGCRVVPAIFFNGWLNWWWVGTIAVLLSIALNSRLARDAEELTAEWIGNAWHDLHARVFGAMLNWVIDFFKQVLGVLERVLYAVDEWLRFHSGETWATLVFKAVVGVFWSFLSFLIRIYVTLLIEPTLHPVKHFPVVTVSHKILLPVLGGLAKYSLDVLTPYTGQALAASIVGFNIFFLPGIFGFAVWELKENWRLYKANRQPFLGPVVVGSHGESVARLLRPGFHSGTLPKLFRSLRRLEYRDASFRRFIQRRAIRNRLHHVELHVRRFVDRDLICLLRQSPVWEHQDLHMGHVICTSNSIRAEIVCARLGPDPLVLLFQEQSFWIVASISQRGWLPAASAEQRQILEAALNGFYRKAAIELVREQLASAFVGRFPYDVDDHGLTIWPDGDFRKEIVVDLERRHQIRPSPAAMAWSYGLQPTARSEVVFADSRLTWSEWRQVWSPATAAESPPLSEIGAGSGMQPVLPGSSRRSHEAE